jgi:hypothetical protein
MIFQPREAPFAGENTLFNICELSAAKRVGIAIPDLGKKRHHRPSHLCDAASKSFGFGFRLCDCGTHDPLDERAVPRPRRFARLSESENGGGQTSRPS